MKEIEYITIKELRAMGLVFEINRRVLHPLGLALEVNIEGDEESIQRVWDCRDDPEGLVFAPAAFTEGKTKFDTFMESEGDKHLEERIERLGFVQQTEPGEAERCGSD